MDYFMFALCLVVSFLIGSSIVDLFFKKRVIGRRLVDLLVLKVTPCTVSFVVIYLGISKRELVKYYSYICAIMLNFDREYYSEVDFESLDDVLNKCFPEVK